MAEIPLCFMQELKTLGLDEGAETAAQYGAGTCAGCQRVRRKHTRAICAQFSDLRAASAWEAGSAHLEAGGNPCLLRGAGRPRRSSEETFSDVALRQRLFSKNGEIWVEPRRLRLAAAPGRHEHF